MEKSLFPFEVGTPHPVDVSPLGITLSLVLQLDLINNDYF
jgi:hypothetical protein